MEYQCIISFIKNETLIVLPIMEIDIADLKSATACICIFLSNFQNKATSHHLENVLMKFYL